MRRHARRPVHPGTSCLGVRPVAHGGVHSSDQPADAGGRPLRRQRRGHARLPGPPVDRRHRARQAAHRAWPDSHPGRPQGHLQPVLRAGGAPVTPGSEPPRHAAQETVEERLAEEVVEELDLHEVPSEDEEPFPSMSEQIAEQLGGVRGLIESSLPVLAFVLLNVLLGDAVLGLDKQTALGWAIAGSVISAVGIGVFRLIRKQPVRHAVNGLFGIAIGAFLAWRTGEAKDFYLPGILLTFGQAAVLLLSVFVRKPIIGYAWGIMANKGHQDWFGNTRLFRTFQWLTLV